MANKHTSLLDIVDENTPPEAAKSADKDINEDAEGPTESSNVKALDFEDSELQNESLRLSTLNNSQVKVNASK